MKKIRHDEWTPVEQDLPNDRENVIVTTKHGVSVGSWDGYTWTGRLGGDHVLNTVKAWKDFPAPWDGKPETAYWVRGEFRSGKSYYHCSYCGARYWMVEDPDKDKIRYCYGCGKRMRGVVNG